MVRAHTSKSQKAKAGPPKRRRSIGEMSFCAALEAGEPWTPAFHRKWCKQAGKSQKAPITVRAELIRAILFVEGAHMSGCEPPLAEAERLLAFGIDPNRRYLAQGLVIDWTTRLAKVDVIAVENEMRETNAFEALPDHWSDTIRAEERERRVRYESEWRRYHGIDNRPRIKGDLDFSGGRFPGAFSLCGCLLEGAGGTDPRTAKPLADIIVDRASFGGLNLSGSSLGNIAAERLQTEGDFHAANLDAHSAKLLGARIGGGLLWDGARLRTSKGKALEADAVEVGADAFLREGFLAHAEIDLRGARVRGQLDCSGGRFELASGRALFADAIEIGTDVFLRNGFLARSEVVFRGAKVGGQFSCLGGRFLAATGRAFYGDAIRIGGDVFLRSGFLATARVVFFRAQIQGSLQLIGGVFLPPETSEDIVLDLHSAEIGASLMFSTPWQSDEECARIFGQIDLSNARCAVLDDSDVRPGTNHQSWLMGESTIRLNGFTYGRLGSNSPTNWKARKAWLDRQPRKDRRGTGFKPQPFEELAKVLREMGHGAEARSAGLIKQWRVHTGGSQSALSVLFRWLLLWPSGYGYRPQYPALFGLAVMLFSIFVTGTAYRLGYMTPAQPHGALASISAELGATPPEIEPCLLADATETVPPFNAGAYVIDAFIPLVDIDQESSWKPARAPRCDGRYTALAPLDEINPGWFTTSYELNWWQRRVSDLAQAGGLHFLQWLLMISGFAISALIAASLSGLIRRD